MIYRQQSNAFQAVSPTVGLITVLAAMWSAPSASAQVVTGNVTVASSSDRLKSLVRETAMQIKIAYWRNPAEKERRREQLTAAVAAWRLAARSADNNQRLAAWLRTAIRRSMPGSSEPLPPLPPFGRPLVAPSGSGHGSELTVVRGESSTGDPFRDDP